MQNERMKTVRRGPLLTYALIAANLLMFAVEFFAGALNSTEALIAVGAQQVFLVTAGEWWRLLTAMFLHGGVEHLLFNMMALYIWGRYAEAMRGRIRYALVYFASGIAGGILSYSMSVSVSVGASGAIFGLFGSFLFLRVYHKEIFNRVFGTQVIILIAVNLLTGFFRPNIDLWGHFGGLAGGFLAAAAVGLKGFKVPAKWRLLAAVALLAVFGGVLVYGYQKYMAIMLAYL
jgi:rhomboid protease GluP